MDDKTIELPRGSRCGVQRRAGHDSRVYFWHQFAGEMWASGRMITPATARELAAALTEAADEAERLGGAGGARVEQFGEQMRDARAFRGQLREAA